MKSVSISGKNAAKGLLAASLLVASWQSQAGGVAFRFSGDTFGVAVAGDMTPESSVQFDWLHNDDDNADMIALGLYANGQRGTLTGRVGAKAVGVDAGDTDYNGGAVAFGGDVGLPFNDLVRARAGFYYAPESTSFSDVTGYREWSMSLEFTLFQNSAIQVGVADTEFKSDGPGNLDFDDGVFLRLQLRL